MKKNTPHINSKKILQVILSFFFSFFFFCLSFFCKRTVGWLPSATKDDINLHHKTLNPFPFSYLDSVVMNSHTFSVDRKEVRLQACFIRCLFLISAGIRTILIEVISGFSHYLQSTLTSSFSLFHSIFHCPQRLAMSLQIYCK